MNGFTTLDLIRHELPLVAKLKPDFVTILIGVNDLVQGRSPEDYRKSLAQIYDHVARQAGARVAAVSIPNWSYAPAAAGFGGEQHVDVLTGVFNDSARREAAARGFTWVDIAEASTSGVGTPGWIASDGLHPGDAQYAAWAEVIWGALRQDWSDLSPR